MYVEVELDKPRKLRYTFNSVADVEEKAGLGIGTLISGERIGFHAIRLLVWGGLKWEEHGLTVQRVGNILQKYVEQGGDLEALFKKAIEALEKSGLAMREESPEADEENPTPPAKEPNFQHKLSD